MSIVHASKPATFKLGVRWAPDIPAEVRGLCYGVKREAASRSGTSQNPQNTNTKSNTNLKTQITRSNSVRGRLLGYAQNRSRRTKYLRFVNRLIELQFLSFIACKTKCEHNSNTCLFNVTSNVSKILTDKRARITSASTLIMRNNESGLARGQRTT